MSLAENINSLKLHDNDKYLALLFAPKAKKNQLAALFNFHYQVSQIPLEVSEPIVGMVKFQWWRDVLAEVKQGKPPRPHPVLLGLQNSNVNYDRLGIVLDNYEKLLDGWQPRGFDELEDFINHTQLIIFEEAANILETVAHENLARAYSYTYLARKLGGNAKTYANFAAAPVTLARQLVARSRELAPLSHNVFAIITRFYNKNLQASRWKLLLKLSFSGASIL